MYQHLFALKHIIIVLHISLVIILLQNRKLRVIVIIIKSGLRGTCPLKAGELHQVIQEAFLLFYDELFTSPLPNLICYEPEKPPSPSEFVPAA